MRDEAGSSFDATCRNRVVGLKGAQTRPCRPNMVGMRPQRQGFANHLRPRTASLELFGRQNRPKAGSPKHARVLMRKRNKYTDTRNVPHAGTVSGRSGDHEYKNTALHSFLDTFKLAISKFGSSKQTLLSLKPTLVPEERRSVILQS